MIPTRMDSLQPPAANQVARAKEITVLPIIQATIPVIAEMHPTVLPATRPTMILQSPGHFRWYRYDPGQFC